MTRVDEYLELVDNPGSQALTPGHPADDAMLALLVHVAFSDGTVNEDELAFLDKVLPGREPAQLMAWIEQVCAHPLDIEAVATALPSTEERWKALRFAARMAWKDGAIEDGEKALLTRLAVGLSLGASAVDRVLSEMQGKAGETIDPERLSDAVEGVAWASVQVLDEPVGGPLATVAPPDATPVRIIAVDDVVVVALYSTGLSAHFLEGTTFIPWASLVTYTRVPTFGAAVTLHTEEGGNWTLVDARLRGLTLLLDRLFAGERKEPTPKPEIVQVRGEEKG